MEIHSERESAGCVRAARMLEITVGLEGVATVTHLTREEMVRALHPGR